MNRRRLHHSQSSDVNMLNMAANYRTNNDEHRANPCQGLFGYHRDGILTNTIVQQFQLGTFIYFSNSCARRQCRDKVALNSLSSGGDCSTTRHMVCTGISSDEHTQVLENISLPMTLLCLSCQNISRDWVLFWLK